MEKYLNIVSGFILKAEYLQKGVNVTGQVSLNLACIAHNIQKNQYLLLDAFVSTSGVCGIKRNTPGGEGFNKLESQLKDMQS